MSGCFKTSHVRRRTIAPARVGSVRLTTAAERALLDAAGWRRRVGRGRGLLVRAADQRVLVIQGRRVLRSYPCSTARAGLGNRRGSGRTPRGWHEIGEKIGAGAPIGAIFKARQWTGQVWTPSHKSDEDLILSRILRLAGLEDGINCGGDVDTWERLIYIHGTNDEASLGTPASHGCVRLSNRDAIELSDLVRPGCPVLVAAE